MCPPRSLKNALFISNEILAILIFIPPTFPNFDAVDRTIINLLALKRRKGCLRGMCPLRS